MSSYTHDHTHALLPIACVSPLSMLEVSTLDIANIVASLNDDTGRNTTQWVEFKKYNAYHVPIGSFMCPSPQCIHLSPSNSLQWQQTKVPRQILIQTQAVAYYL